MSSDIKDYIGQKINNFKVLDAKREGKRTMLKIVCPICGNEKWMRLDGIKEAVSCGCLRQEKQFAAKDLSGQKFGRLTAIKNTGNKNKKGSYLWEFQCECGNIAEVSAGDLIQGRVRSCGCLAKEKHIQSGKMNGKNIKDNYYVLGTNANNLVMRTSKRNTSGRTGVYWDKRRQKWTSQIRFSGKNYYLGRYKNKEDAITARENAEKHIFGDFLEWYAESHPEQWKRKIISKKITPE